MKLFNKITHFFRPQLRVIAVFLIAMLVPNLVLACTEPYSATTIVASFLLPAGFYLLWTLVSARPGIMILWAFPFMILGAFQLVLVYLFGGSIIAVDMFTNLFTTSVTEAGELLGNIYPAIIGVCVLYIPLIALAVWAVQSKERLTRRQRIRGAVGGVILMILGGLFCLASEMRNPDFMVKRHIFPANVIYNIKLSVERWNRSLDYPQTSKDFRFGATKEHDSTRREIYVMVIGEASRAASWSLFGYERETTPRLAKTEGLVPFRDILTQSNTTHKSVPIILSGASAENFDSIYVQKSMVALFREAGFRTVFISNEPANRSLIDFFAQEADTTINVTSHSGEFSEEHLDEDILPHLREQIAATDGNLFIVLHTYGSHFAYFKRYPRQFARFTPDQATAVKRSTRDRVVNSYDNSVLYTDYILSQVIATLDSTKAVSALLYAADHGEDLMDDRRNRFLHASPTTTYYQLHIASFAWFSEPYRTAFPEKYAAAVKNKDAAGSTGSVFHTIADIGSVRSRYVDPTWSLVSDRWQYRPRMYLNDYDEATNFLDTGLTDLDRQMLDKHGIRYDKKDVHKIRY